MRDFTLANTTVALSDKLAYSAGSLGKELVQGLISLCVFLYCYQVLDLDLTFICALYLINQITGIICAPIFGFLLDNTKSRFGKYKPWIFLGTLINLLTLIGFYWATEMPRSSMACYVMVIYALWSISFFMIDIPSSALLSIFNSNNATRETMASVPCITHALGCYLLVVCALPILDKFPTLFTKEGIEYPIAAICAFVILLISQGVLLVFLQSRPNNCANKAAKSNTKQQFLPPLPTDNSSDNDEDGQAYSHEDSSSSAKRYVDPELQVPPHGASSYFDAPNVHSTHGSKGEPHPYERAYNFYRNSAKSDLNVQMSYDDHDLAAMVADEFNVEQVDKSFKKRFENVLSNFDRYSSLSHTAYQHQDTEAGYSALYGTRASAVDYSSVLGSDKSMTQQTGNMAYAFVREAEDQIRDRQSANTANDSSSSAASAAEAYAAAGYAPRASSYYGASFESLEQNNNSAAAQLASMSFSNRLRMMFLVLKKNDQLIVLFLCGLLLNIASGLTMGACISFFTASNQAAQFVDNTLYSILIIGCLLMIFSMASFESLVRVMSRGVVFNFAICLFVCGIVLLFFAPDAKDSFFPIMGGSIFLCCCSLGLWRVSLTSMSIDTVDYGEFKLSLRTDGIVFALRTTANHIGQAVSFFFYGGSLALTFILNDDSGFIPEFSLNLTISVVAILCLLTVLLYSNYYKLNGSFYRNVLNNLQYLRQNQRATSARAPSRFMLRYTLDESTMIIKLKANNLDELIKAMVQKLSKVNAITSEQDYMSDLKARLEQGSCGIAEGIALPHAKSSSVRRATVVVATLDTPLDLGALDDRKCDLIFLLASPDDGQTNLKLLGRLSLLLNEPGFADKLRSSGSTTEMFERLIQCEKRIIK